MMRQDIPLIRCAICDKPVDELAWQDDLSTMGRVYRVKCHGEYEVTRLDRYCLDIMTIEGGTAFTAKRIEVHA